MMILTVECEGIGKHSKNFSADVDTLITKHDWRKYQGLIHGDWEQPLRWVVCGTLVSRPTAAVAEHIASRTATSW